MPAIGVVVEGIYDEAALAELIRKCANSEVDVICRLCGSAIQLMRKFPGFLESFRHVKEGSPVDNAIVIRDADHKDPNELIACVFRTIPAGYFARFQPPISEHSGPPVGVKSMS